MNRWALNIPTSTGFTCFHLGQERERREERESERESKWDNKRVSKVWRRAEWNKTKQFCTSPKWIWREKWSCMVSSASTSLTCTRTSCYSMAHEGCLAGWSKPNIYSRHERGLQVEDVQSTLLLQISNFLIYWITGFHQTRHPACLLCTTTTFTTWALKAEEEDRAGEGVVVVMMMMYFVCCRNRDRSRKLAVMIWVYGGGFYSGTST